jgi:hypothetical protein
MAGWGGISQLIEDAQRRRGEENRWRPQRLEPPRQSSWTSPPLTRIDNPPPLPEIRPMASPVMELKRQTARGYTPEATHILYETPMRVRFGSPETHTSDTHGGPLGSEGVGGFYTGGDTQKDWDKEIYLNSAQPEQSYQSELAHEFAHKWYETQMPEEIKYQWKQNSQELSSPYANERVKAYDPMADIPNERYAFNVMNGPYGMDDETRSYYYAGLYEDDQREWERPKYLPLPEFLPRNYGETWGPPNWNNPPTSDILRERRPWSQFDSNGFAG